MFYDEVLAFDHVRKQIQLMVLPIGTPATCRRLRRAEDAIGSGKAAGPGRFLNEACAPAGKLFREHHP